MPFYQHCRSSCSAKCRGAWPMRRINRPVRVPAGRHDVLRNRASFRGRTWCVMPIAMSDRRRIGGCSFTVIVSWMPLCDMVVPSAIGASVYGSRPLTTSRLTNLAEAASAFVWIWLPGEVRPVPAGRLHGGTERRHDFGYLSDYLDRPNAIALGPDLPLSPGMRALPGPGLNGTLRDALPGRWGRRVTQARQLDRRDGDVDPGAISDIGYGLLAGTDGIGALSYQASATTFEARLGPAVELSVLAAAVERVEAGQDLPPDLAAPLIHAVAIGGAQPQVLVEVEGRPCIAKFASAHDHGDRLRAEFTALRLAGCCGFDVPGADLRQIGDRSVLLIERFDRDHGGLIRRAVTSGRTLIGLTGQRASNAGWQERADALTRSNLLQSTRGALRELFRRMAFGTLLGDTDSSACNPFFFWDGRQIELAPVHSFSLSLNPEWSFGWENEIHRSRQRVQLTRMLDHAPGFGLGTVEATSIVDGLVHEMSRHYSNVRSEVEAWDTSKSSSLKSSAICRRLQPGEVAPHLSGTTSGGTCLS